MDTITDALAEQQAELADLLDAVEDGDWQRPSRCEGWTVADVVLHLAQTNELAIASVQGRFLDVLESLVEGLQPETDVEAGAGLMVEHERGTAPEAVHERWRRSADGLHAVLRHADPHARVQWVAGDMSTRTLATTRLAESWIHTGDVGVAFGRTPQPSRRLWHISRLAWRTLPHAFARVGRELSGPVAFHLRADGADDAEVWDFVPDEPPVTIVEGDALDLCLVAGQRGEAPDTSLRARGPDAHAVLELVRTFA